MKSRIIDENQKNKVQTSKFGGGVHRHVHDVGPLLERDALENREPGVRDVVEVNQAAVRVPVLQAPLPVGARVPRPVRRLPPRAVLLAVLCQEHVRPDRRVVGERSRRVDAGDDVVVGGVRRASRRAPAVADGAERCTADSAHDPAVWRSQPGGRPVEALITNETLDKFKLTKKWEEWRAEGELLP